MLPRIKPNLEQDHWLAGPEVERSRCSLVVGATYRFLGLAGPRRANGTQGYVFPPADYRLLGVARNVRTWQDQVVYVGVGGEDEGRMYVATLCDWAEHFRLVGAEGEGDGK